MKVQAMTIKDYIHLYIGQHFQFDNKQWKMVAVSRRLVTGWRDISEVSSREIKVYHNEAKLILRRLSDMTDDDLKKMVNEFALIDLSNCQYEYETVEGKWVNAIENGVVVTSLEVLDGDYVSMMHKDDEMMPMVPQSKAFHYLLKQGFDLFGLLDAGLAIDAKSIQSPTP